MRIKKYTVTLILLLSTLYIYPQSSFILVDFGSISSPLPWNNISDTKSGSISGMINSFGITTNISLEVIDSFNGINTSGTQSPDMSLGIPNTASGDSYFGNTKSFSGEIQSTGGIRISHLDPNKKYNFTIFSSRLASDNRETKYVFSGLTYDSAFLNVSNNTSSVVEFSSFPSTSGTVDIIASPGPNNDNSYGFFYLGALIIEYQSDSTVNPRLNLLEPNGGEFWQVSKNVEIKWENTTQNLTIIEYSTDNGTSWNLIDTVPVFQYSYAWDVPNMPSKQCLIRIRSNTLTDQSDGLFEISASTDYCPIVVIGSSTAAGAGASTSDSAWVNRFRNKIYENDTRYPVFNLALGGYTTYHLLPSGNPLADDVGITIDTARNITKALSLNPSGIIVNLPSNDAARNFSVQEQMRNFNIIVDEADQQGVKIWVCTTQPRYFSNSSQLQIQKDTRDSILATFGYYSIDFWNGLADTNGFILSEFNSGDGVHLNDQGHRFLLERVLEKGITDSLCNFSTVGVKELIANSTLTIQAYPNPFRSNLKLHVESEKTGSMAISLYDIYGRELYTVSKNIRENEHHTFEIYPTISSELKTQLLILKVQLNHEGELLEKTTPLLYLK